MDERTQGEDRREFDLAVLGATGVTGRLVAQRLQTVWARPGSPSFRWAAAGRDAERVRRVLRSVDVHDAAVVVADLGDDASVRALASRTRVLLNLAGPYTRTAEFVIARCVAAGTSYVDLSGELPLLERVNRRFHDAARAAGVQVVQMAGWEALPADVTTMLAARAALESEPESESGRAIGDGPGAGEGIERIEVDVRFSRTPGGRPTLKQSVSGGTVGSIAAQLLDNHAAIVGDPAGLLPPGVDRSLVRRRSPLRLRPHVAHARVLGPIAPVAFLNPPVVHRTAALLAAEHGRAHQPARYQEGGDRGSATGRRSVRAVLGAAASAALQRGFVVCAKLPTPARRALIGLLSRFAPAAGSGPTGRHLTDWAWSVRAEAVGSHGGRGTAVLHGTGHPGYTATATIIAAVGLHLIAEASGRSGCLTPALSLGTTGARGLDTDELRLVEG